MASEKSNFLYSDTEIQKNNHIDVEIIGQKAAGLALIPSSWRPPFVVLTIHTYSEWLKAADIKERRAVIQNAANLLLSSAKEWDVEWKRGIILRSSSTNESMDDRGAFESRDIPADFNLYSISEAIKHIFLKFKKENTDGKLALLLQPLIDKEFLGHCSNELRFSKTINHWVWAFDDDSNMPPERYNSQRNNPPDVNKPLRVSNPAQVVKLLRSLGRWCSQLKKGRTHLEWGISDGKLWVLQIDSEDERSDPGVNPRELIRDSDTRPTGKVDKQSFIMPVDYASLDTGWSKIDNVKDLVEVHKERYPTLFTITGTDLQKALKDRKKLKNQIAKVTHGRAVCRTACKAEKAKEFNLPRTDTYSPEKAVSFLANTLESLMQQGAKAEECCFIIHKFIPAVSAAWAYAEPEKQIVKIDALWGVPDGLQFYPHDSFEVNVKLNRVLSEKCRYKPFLVQELADGSWKRLQVKRPLARGKSIFTSDLKEIAIKTHALALKKEGPISVMWFSGIPKEVGIGKNLPWLVTPTHASMRQTSIAPRKPRFEVCNYEGIAEAANKPTDHVLILNPVVELIRDQEFFTKIIELAKEKGFSVEFRGSTLAHAYYEFERSGIAVFPSDPPKYTRTRGKQVFGKIVRDRIPDKITEGGENVLIAEIPQHESRAALLAKLLEEAFELKSAQTRDEVMAELADVLEVVKSLSLALGIDWSDIEKAAERKREERGSFQDNVVLMQTSWPSDKKQESKPITISIKELAKSAPTENGANLPFPCFFIDQPGAKVTLPSGQKITISFSANGLRITEEKTDLAISENQLTLFSDTESYN